MCVHCPFAMPTVHSPATASKVEPGKFVTVSLPGSGKFLSFFSKYFLNCVLECYSLDRIKFVFIEFVS